MATNESPPNETVEENVGVGVVKEEGGVDPRPNSPDPSCPICLDDVIDAAFTDMCGHRFCFNCLATWSRVKPECPLCKQRFSLIIHNIRSWADYDLLPVVWPEPPTPPLDANFFISLAFQRPRFRYRTTGGGWGWRMQDVLGGPSSNPLLPSSSIHNPIPPSTLVPSHSYSPPISAPTSFPHPHGNITSYVGNTVATEWRRRRQVCAVEFRRNIYRQNMWVCPPQPRPGSSLRVRDCTPSFLRNNSAQVHRLIPWLHRELLVLLDVCYDYKEVCQMICHAITNVSIRSQSFHSMLWPYLRDRTSHFCHEFYHFASSPFDMLAYDSRAEYVRRSPPGYIVPALSDRENNSDSSDIEVIEPENRDEPIEISDEEVIRVEVAGNDSDASVEIISTLPPLAERQPEVIDLVDDSGSDMELEPSTFFSRPGCSKEKSDQRHKNKEQPFYKDESSSFTDVEMGPFARSSCSEDRRDRACSRLRNKEPPIYKDESSSSIDVEMKPSSSLRSAHSEDRRLGDRLRSREMQFYKDGSSSSERESSRRKHLKKRKKKCTKPLKKRKRIIENYSSSENEEDREDSDNVNLEKDSRSKSKSLPSTSSIHSTASSRISQEKQNSKSSSSNFSPSSSRSRSDHRNSPQPNSSKSRSKCRDRKRSSESRKTSSDFQVKYESTSSQNFTPPPSTSDLSLNFSELTEPKQEEIDNFLTSSIAQLFPPLNSQADSGPLDDGLINSYSSRSPSPPKPRLKSVVRKVEPDEAGCSNWHSHNLRQRKFTSHAYTPYFSLSDSES